MPVPIFRHIKLFYSYLWHTDSNVSDPRAKFNHLSLALGVRLIKNVLVNSSCHQNQVISQLLV